jgi:acetyl esterase/lipase
MLRIFGLLVLVLGLVGCAEKSPLDRTTVAYDPAQSMGTYDVYRARGDVGTHPAIIFIHGGGFFTGSKKDGEKYAESLCHRGFVVLSVNYRTTTAGNLWPVPYDDVRAAVRHIHEHAAQLNIGPRIGVMGASAGGCMALKLHYEDGPARPYCAVSISGEGDLVHNADIVCFSDFDFIMSGLFGHPAPFSREERAQLSPALSARHDARVLVVHSTGDSNVSINQAESNVASLRAQLADVVYMRRFGYAHGDDLWGQDSGARGEVFSYLRTQLGQ